MVTQAETLPTDSLADLAAEFPSWHIWRGRDGRGADKGWYATRQHRLTADELDDGLKPMLFADDTVSLHGQLAQQQVTEQRMASGAT